MTVPANERHALEQALCYWRLCVVRRLPVGVRTWALNDMYVRHCMFIAGVR